MVFEICCGVALGLLGGLLYFEGLWQTVQRVASSNRPYVLLAGSWVVRTTGLLLGGVLVALWSAPALAAALAGFLVGRAVLTRRHGAAS